MFEPEELMARIVDLEEQLKVSEMAPPAAEQLIACLEGEIAKRDEELAACRVAVENCEVFRARIAELENIVDKAWNRSHQLEHGAYIPGALDAWKRPVLQNLPYDFSGNPGTPATQYCNGWNDAGGYWKAHVDDLLAELADIKAQEPVAAIPAGYSLVPSRIDLSHEDIAAIMFMCGGDADATELDEQFHGGTLWIGGIDDDGDLIYGMHLSCTECPEEGSTTIAEFAAPVFSAKSGVVVLPEYRTINLADSDADQNSDKGYNAAIDEVARLNAADHAEGEKSC